jgi:poly-gamma-glutamate synthesis protein (capsule biosynthesis protein)
MLEVMISGPSPTLPSFTAQTGADKSNPSHQNSSPTPDESLEATRSVNLADPANPDDPTNLVNAPERGSAPATSVSPKHPSNRPTVVDTALEPVGVISHQKTTPAPTDEVTLLFGGDISLDSLDYSQLEGEGGFFAEVEDYFQADVSMVNLATPLATAATSLNEELHQKTRPDAVELLVESGIDIVNLTNSNLMQFGAEGLSETLTALDSKGLYRVGAGRNAMEARRPEILDVKGKRIAYLSYAMGGDNAAMDTNALKERAGADDKTVAKELENFKRSTAFKDRAGFNAQNMPEIVADLQAIRDDVDWIVVNFRWVEHLDEKPNFVQTNLARLAIDQGADVVVGYHPTVIQGGEIYKGRPIAYSLGDFVFKADQPIEDQDSAMLKVSLQDEKMKVEFVPVRVRDSRPKTLVGKEGEEVLQRIQQASAQFEDPIPTVVDLDLKAPVLPPAETPAPDSPFVTPGADQTLPLEPDSKTKPDDVNKPDAEESTEPGQPEAVESAPADSLPAVDLRDQIDELQEWGPKGSPQQQEFQPIPQNRSGVAPGNLDAQARPNLLRQLTAPLSNPAKASPVTPPAEATPWTDNVPAVPTPEAIAPQPVPTAEEKANPAVTPSVNPAPEVEEKGDPQDPTIPAQAEPLVGPLGTVEDSPTKSVALGSALESVDNMTEQ